ncbi:MAG: hypothetical protein KGY74_09770 [Candidatus Cloacimonetes bacterium]|nr:hypothetical protein [Candidatus Cloacimonadota bacterium]
MKTRLMGKIGKEKNYTAKVGRRKERDDCGTVRLWAREQDAGFRMQGLGCKKVTSNASGVTRIIKL